MKKKHILLGCLVGMVVMAGCENGGSMETNATNTKETYHTEVTEPGGKESDVHSRSETVTEEGLPPEETTGVSQEDVGETKETEPEKESVENFLQTALQPVGSTMYVWGGGWNEEDTGAGIGATTVGILPSWAEFAALQDEDYYYKDHKYELLNGLDCSGYLGWVVYNVFEETDGQEGYVFQSTKTAETYSGLGWGELLENPESFLPGDVVSMKGHVWISLGMCEDGSVVVLHASPPGVSVCGTPGDARRAEEKEQPETEEGDSLAVTLAKQYMEAHYPDWQERYPKRDVKSSYTENVTVLRWNSETFPDAKEWQALSAKEVLERLSGE